MAENGDETQKPDTRDAAYNPAVDASPRPRSTGPRRPVSAPPPARESAQAFFARRNAVMLIQDPKQRLEAIRKRLGMNISDALYQKALAAYGYQNDSGRLFTIIWPLWVYDDPAAATQWVHRFGYAELLESFGSEALAQWMHVDPARAMA